MYLEPLSLRERFRSPFMKEGRVDKLSRGLKAFSERSPNNIKRKSSLITEQKENSLSPTKIWQIAGYFYTAVYSDDGSIYLLKNEDDDEHYGNKKLIKI